jgi:uroporphyrinogen decarboxylase
MRQAGRYLPQYRALRAQHDLLTLARTPELAAEITLQPVEELGVDAAIVFADILLPLLPMGASFRFAEGEGPVFDRPLQDRDDIDRLRVIDAAELSYVGETLRLCAQALPSDVALIGFAGAPFTLASYLVEGGFSRTFGKTKRLMLGETELWRVLMEKLAEVCLRYLKMQIEAGAQAVQIFDSWVGCLGPADYETYALPYSAYILQGLRGAGAVTLHFGTDTATLLPLMSRAGSDVLGVDWRVPLDEARSRIAAPMTLQGNLDPATLLAPPDQVLKAARRVLGEGRSGAHIFNTGHGLMPETPVDNVRRVVDLVHSLAVSAL